MPNFLKPIRSTSPTSQEGNVPPDVVTSQWMWITYCNLSHFFFLFFSFAHKGRENGTVGHHDSVFVKPLADLLEECDKTDYKERCATPVYIYAGNAGI